MDIIIPADVPASLFEHYHAHMAAITQNTGNLMLFACDQKIEHLNNDFVGAKIPAEVQHPQHLFSIAEYGRIGAMAAPLGLIARYGKLAPNTHYIVKLNGKTNIIPLKTHDPMSAPLWTVEDVIQFKRHSGLSICGVGMTIYLGSIYESSMLSDAARMIAHAHAHGLLTLLWIYPRGAAVSDEQDAHLLAGAAGLATALGSDFVKIKPPQGLRNKNSADLLQEVTNAAGLTSVICAGGSLENPETLFRTIYDQLHIGKTRGSATGRNIFQRSLKEAIAMTHAISALVYDDATPGMAYDIYQKALL